MSQTSSDTVQSGTEQNQQQQKGQSSSDTVQLGTEQNQDQNQNQQQQVEKPRRGRPRKYNPDRQTGQTSSNPVRLDTEQNQDQNQQQQVEKPRRGRPRKNNPDSQTSPLLPPPPRGGNFSDPTANRKRGRPPGSRNKQPNALVVGANLNARIIQVNPGEDIYAKLMALSDQGPITISVISVHGSVATVNLRKDSESSEFVTYEGKFEILSLNGSFVNDGTNRSGSLSVVFSGADNQIVGGGVVNSLVAASQVQIVVGSCVNNDDEGDQNPEPAANMLQSGSVSQRTRSSTKANKTGETSV